MTFEFCDSQPLIQQPDFPITRQVDPVPARGSCSGRSRPSPAVSDRSPRQCLAGRPRSTVTNHVYISKSTYRDLLPSTGAKSKYIARCEESGRHYIAGGRTAGRPTVLCGGVCLCAPTRRRYPRQLVGACQQISGRFRTRWAMASLLRGLTD